MFLFREAAKKGAFLMLVLFKRGGGDKGPTIQEKEFFKNFNLASLSL